MADLATLVVKLEAQTAAFTKGMKESKEAVEGLGARVAEIVPEMVRDFLSIEGAKKAFEWVSEVAEELSKLREESEAVGISASKLADIQFAAKLTGVDDVIGPLERLARASREAIQGNHTLEEAFYSIGISVKDLEKLTPDQLLDRISNKLATMQDSFAKTALVLQLFGRSSSQMIDYLNRGSEGIRKLEADADALGQHITDAQAKQAQELNELGKEIAAGFGGEVKQAIVKAGPDIAKLYEDLLDFNKETDAVKSIGAVVGTVVADIANAVKYVFDILKPILEPIGSFIADVIKDLLALGSAIGGTLKEPFLVVSEALGDVIKELHNFYSEMVAVGKESSLLDELLGDLAFSFKIIAAGVLVVEHAFETVVIAIQGAYAVIEKLMEAPTGVDFLKHPLEAAKRLKELFPQVGAIAQDTLNRINQGFEKGDEQLADLFSDHPRRPKAHEGDDKTKSPYTLPDIRALQEALSILGELEKEQDKLNKEINSFGQGAEAAELYNVQFGALSEKISRLNSIAPELQQHFLDIALRAHQISQADFDKLSAALKETGSIGLAAQQNLIKLAETLQSLKDVDAIVRLDEAMLKLTGHEKEAAEAAAILANRQLEFGTTELSTRRYLSQFEGASRVAEAQKLVNDLTEQAAELETKLQDAIQLANSTDIKTSTDGIAQRTVVIAQLQELQVRMSAIAEAAGSKTLINAANDLSKYIGAQTQLFGQVDIKRVNDINIALAQYTSLQKEAAEAQTALQNSLKALNEERSSGAITDLGQQQLGDEARAKYIQQLNEIEAKVKAINDATGNSIPQIVEGYNKLSTAISETKAQMDQLNKAIAEDFVNETNNAFSDFILGTKSARDAAKELLQGLESDLVRLANKQLLEKIFGLSNSNGESTAFNNILNLFTKGQGDGQTVGGEATSALVGSTLKDVDTSTSKALKDFSIPGLTDDKAATSIESAFTTGGPSAGNSIQTAMVSAGEQVAAKLSSSMLLSSLLGGHGGGGGLGGLLGLFGGAGGIGSAADSLATSAVEDFSSSFHLASIAPLALAKGGPTYSNEDYIVGEEGKELFIPDDGSRARYVGLLGPEKFKDPRPGKIVPHEQLAGMNADNDVFKQLEKRRDGGSVTSGQPYIVGEEGPELIIPAASGTVIPNEVLNRKGGLTVNNHFNITAPQGTVSRATQSQLAAQAARSVQIATHRNT